jgi:hypothetical protein
MEVYQAMTNQFPSLTFTVRWEEEQGFGEDLELRDGNVSVIDRWDSPNCHEDYRRRDNEDGCVCSWSEDKTDWYDDCPNKNKFKFVVETITKRVIITSTPEVALATAEADEAGIDTNEDIATIEEVIYAEEYRIVSKEEV